MLDLALPVMNGYEVARQLRRQHKQDVRLITMTDYGQDSDRQSMNIERVDSRLVTTMDLWALVAGSPVLVLQ